MNAKELVTRFIDLAFVKNDIDEASKLIATGYRLHDPSRAGGGSTGVAGWKEAQRMYLKGLPDRRWTILDQFQDGDVVITRWAIEATHSGELPGIPATRRRIKVEGIVITRVENDQIAEQWQVWDMLGFLEQLGVEAPPLLKAG